MVETEHSVAEACRNCSHPLDGPFCAKCGQAEHDGHPPTLGHFFHDLVHEFVHVDGTIFRTLKALFLQPGKLTEEYWAGHVVSWVRPLRLFLIIAAVHLLVSTGVGPLNLKLQVTRDAKGELNIGLYTEGQLQKLRHGETLVPEAERQEILEKLEKVYHAIRYFSVIVFALASWLLYFRKQHYFASHLIAGLHFYSFWYVLAAVAALVGRWQPALEGLAGLSWIYLFFALRRLFHQHWLLTLAKTFALFFVVLATELGLSMSAAMLVLRFVKH